MLSLRLSTLMLALLGLLAPTAVQADEATAVIFLRGLDANIEVDSKLPGSPAVLVNLNSRPVKDVHLREQLQELMSLRTLKLCDCRLITEDGLKKLKDLAHLQVLHLQHTAVTDAVLKELKDLVHLQVLELQYTAVTDAGLKELKELKSLRALQLEGTKITDAGLKELKELMNLERLGVAGTRVTNAGLTEMKALRNLQFLNLEGVSVDNAGLLNLTELKNLRYLRLSGIFDTHLKVLKELKSLQMLELKESSISTVDFEAALPNAKIHIPVAGK